MDFTAFHKLICKEDIIKDTIIQLKKDDVLYIDSFTELKISNCSFEGGNLIIRGNNEESKIDNLIIEKSSIKGLEIIDLEIENLKILDVSVDYIKIIKSSFKDFCIMGLDKVDYNIELYDLKVSNKTEILGNKFIRDGSLSIFDSELNNCRFIESTFNNVIIQSSCLKGYFDFYKNNLNPESERFLFSNSTFEKTNFSRTTLSKNTEFDNCDFSGTTIFHEMHDYPGSTLRFESCLFKKYVQFNYASISKFEIDNSKFNEVSSFQDTKFHTISIDRTTFEKPAFFDNINIQNINSLNIRTLRIIKQQLQRTDNKIDYNRFRGHELAAYKEELIKEVKTLKTKISFTDRLLAKDRNYAKVKRDLFILKLSEFTSDYGTDWKRAFKFICLSGLTLYILFFLSENIQNDMDWNNWQIFPIGLLRFFVLTDFYNPLQDGRTLISMNGWNHLISWVIFIFGKIVIAFGIYEMIQAFRKFKA